LESVWSFEAGYLWCRGVVCEPCTVIRVVTQGSVICYDAFPGGLRLIRVGFMSVLGPGVDCGCCWAKGGGESIEVVGVAGEDVVVESHGADDEVGVDDVGGSGLGEEVADGSSVVEGVDGDGVDEGGEAGLSWTSPDLGYDRVGGVERSPGTACGSQEGVG